MMTISREAKMALLAIGAYWDIRDRNEYSILRRDESNQAPLPEGWEVIKEKSGSGDNVQWLGSGFSARAYRKQSVSGKQDKIVISFAGTEFGNSYLGFAQDMFGTNIPLAIGLDAAQAYCTHQ